MEFKFSDEEKKLRDEWIAEHRKVCEKANQRDVTGACFSYWFLPTGLGPVVKVQCECGAEGDMTADFDL